MAKKNRVSQFWQADVERAAQEILGRVNERIYEVAWELFTYVVSITPSPSNPGEYAKGLLANQWYPSAGQPIIRRGTATDPFGQASLDRIDKLTKGNGNQFLMRDGRLVMTNSVDYAVRAEQIGWPANEGWSGRVGPYRMVALSLRRISAKYKVIKL